MVIENKSSMKTKRYFVLLNVLIMVFLSSCSKTDLSKLSVDIFAEAFDGYSGEQELKSGLKAAGYIPAALNAYVHCVASSRVNVWHSGDTLIVFGEFSYGNTDVDYVKANIRKVADSNNGDFRGVVISGNFSQELYVDFMQGKSINGIVSDPDKLCEQLDSCSTSKNDYSVMVSSELPETEQVKRGQLLGLFYSYMKSLDHVKGYERVAVTIKE